MTTYGKGWLSKCGVVSGSTWGTPVAVGTGNLVEFLSENIGEDIAALGVEEISGNANYTDVLPSVTSAGGDLSLAMRYTGTQHDLIAMAFGSQASPVLAGTRYTSEYTMKNSLEGLFCTLVFAKQAAIWEWKSAKVNGLSISGSPGAFLQLNIPFICSALDTASTTNTSSQINALTSLSGDRTDVINWTHMTAYALPTSGGATLDEIKIQEFSFSIDNALSSVYASGNSGIIDEPKRDGFRTVSLSIKLDYYKDDYPTGGEWIAMYKAKTPFKFKFHFVNADDDRALVIMIPNAYPTGSVPRDVSGPALLEATLDFQCQMISSAPSGFTTSDTVALTSGVTVNPGSDITEEARIFTENDISSAWI